MLLNSLLKFSDDPALRYCSVGEDDQVVDQGTGGAGGADQGAGGTDQGSEQGTGGGERPSLRETLERSVDQVRQGDRSDRGDGRDNMGRLTQRGARENAQRQRAAQQTTGGAAPAAGAQQGSETGTGAQAQDQGGAAAAGATRPPQAWSREAQAEWERLPPAVQAAVAKRETDTARGVEELRSRYNEIDRALEPHMDAIRTHRKTPAEAVAQMFGWFQALAARPDEAFPALLKAFNYDPAKLTPSQQQGAQPGAQQQGTTQGAQPGTQQLPPELRQLVEQMVAPLNQKVQMFDSMFVAQNEQKTMEVIGSWASDKPHFEAVRRLMGQLIQSGAVPPKDGRVDLDTAYEMACNATKSVREAMATEAAAKAEQERQAANQTAAQAAVATQQQQTRSARQAAVTLRPGAPGSAPPAGQKQQPKQRRSVRESINDALEELSTGS